MVPGSHGRVYYTDTRDCPDRRERDETCKHIRAVRLWTQVHGDGTQVGARRR